MRARFVGEVPFSRQGSSGAGGYQLVPEQWQNFINGGKAGGETEGKTVAA
jgi:hypothetical protein